VRVGMGGDGLGGGGGSGWASCGCWCIHATFKCILCHACMCVCMGEVGVIVCISGMPSVPHRWVHWWVWVRRWLRRWVSGA
jgi:hypothetical protein